MSTVSAEKPEKGLECSVKGDWNEKKSIDEVWGRYSKFWLLSGCEDMPYVQTIKQMLKKRVFLTLVWIIGAATANVDPENEEKLIKAVEALTSEKTIVMIAHRLKTVRNADQILVIDKGRIAEKGTHEKLYKYNGMRKRRQDEVGHHK